MTKDKKLQEQHKEGRKVNPFAMYLDSELQQALDNFMAAQRVKPTKSDVGVVALQEFLAKEGFYPPKRST